MRVPVETLSAFYASRLGQITADLVRRGISKLWPDVRDLDLLGLGYAIPYLEGFTAPRRLITAMPASQGVLAWPQGCNATTLTEELHLPFDDAQFDRVVLVHALEDSSDPALLLREVWRITAPEGRILVVTTCRQGLWAAGEHTPFGHGRPYSRGQLSAALNAAMFEPTAHDRVLYMPPVEALCGLAEMWERAGSKIWPRLSGVVMVEAVKRLYAPTHNPQPKRVLMSDALTTGWSHHAGVAKRHRVPDQKIMK
jgi:SAM-dependent methyltransferase